MNTIWGRVENTRTIREAVWCSTRVLYCLGIWEEDCPLFCQCCAEWPGVAHWPSLRLGFPTFEMGIWVDWYLLALLFRVHTVINKPVYDVFSLGLSTVFRFTGLETGGLWRSRGKAALLPGLWISSGCSLTLIVSSHPCVLGPPPCSVRALFVPFSQTQFCGVGSRRCANSL